jgi:protein SCO1/2
VLDATTRSWSVPWRSAHNGAYVDHASVVTLVDPQGRLRAHYGLSQLADPAAMARDIGHVLAG